MASCPHHAVCNGGCPHDRYIARKYDRAFDGRCCGQSALIAHIKAKVAGRLDGAGPARMAREPAAASVGA